MKSVGGLLWTAALITMLWLAIVADAYYLSDKEASAISLDSVALRFMIVNV